MSDTTRKKNASPKTLEDKMAAVERVVVKYSLKERVTLGGFAKCLASELGYEFNTAHVFVVGLEDEVRKRVGLPARKPKVIKKTDLSEKGDSSSPPDTPPPPPPKPPAKPLLMREDTPAFRDSSGGKIGFGAKGVKITDASEQCRGRVTHPDMLRLGFDEGPGGRRK